MEWQSNKTLWAGKLQEVSLPEAGKAWEAMALLLDKEMPEDRKRRRRWLLLILLLPLLVGAGYFAWEGRSMNRPIPTRGADLPPLTGKSAAPVSGGSGSSPSAQAHSDGTSPVPSRVAQRTRGNDVEKASSDNGVMAVSPRQQRDVRRSDPGSIVSLGIVGPDLKEMGIALSPAKNAKQKATPHSNDPLKCPPVERPQTTGFVVGIGLNQSLPVNGQQVWTNPSGGLNQWWKDYIPVPFVRYYFQPKVFVQVDARIHAPQYTSRDLWFSYISNGTAYTVFIKKLYYFQLPVTVHYAPAPDWSIGLGLQYSHYGSGIAALPDSNQNHYYFTGPLSDYPMVYVQHNEFRGLVSLDYTYRRWIIGASYDEAFTKAVSKRIANLPATPGSTFTELPPPVRNSSSQVYLRYILWDGRKKK